MVARTMIGRIVRIALPALVLGLLIGSWSHGVMVAVYDRKHTSAAVVHRGLLRLSVADTQLYDGPWRIRLRTIPPDAMTYHARWLRWLAGADARRLAGIEVHFAQTKWPQGPQYAHHEWVIPAFPVLFLACVPFLFSLARTLKRKRAAQIGECLRCGYDLRGLPDACPECGTTIRQDA